MLARRTVGTYWIAACACLTRRAVCALPRHTSGVLPRTAVCAIGRGGALGTGGARGTRRTIGGARFAGAACRAKFAFRRPATGVRPCRAILALSGAELLPLEAVAALHRANLGGGPAGTADARSSSFSVLVLARDTELTSFLRRFLRCLVPVPPCRARIALISIRRAHR